MKKNHRISKEIKDEILDKIKNQGLTVLKASEHYGVSTVSIYKWLGQGVTSQPSWKQFNKLQKENKMLFELVGELTMKISTTQKKK